ncbi:MAG: pirin family protein [Planctomycetota bacterium]
MITRRPAAERGHANHGWLNSHHSFSFAEYHDPSHMGFRSLRVVNDDQVAPGQGFGSHPHRDMEILSYVLRGKLEHKDNLGNGAVIGPGEFQRITAGRGVVHSEFNPSMDEHVHFYQVWIKPRAHGLEPGYEELDANPLFADGVPGMRLVASANGRDGSLTIQQDADVWLGRFGEGEQAEHRIAEGRGVWVQVLRGGLTVNGAASESGDGVAIEQEPAVELTATSDGAEVLVFDLP